MSITEAVLSASAAFSSNMRASKSVFLSVMVSIRNLSNALALVYKLSCNTTRLPVLQNFCMPMISEEDLKMASISTESALGISNNNSITFSISLQPSVSTVCWVSSLQSLLPVIMHHWELLQLSDLEFSSLPAASRKSPIFVFTSFTVLKIRVTWAASESSHVL